MAVSNAKYLLFFVASFKVSVIIICVAFDCTLKFTIPAVAETSVADFSDAMFDPS